MAEVGVFINPRVRGNVFVLSSSVVHVFPHNGVIFFISLCECIAENQSHEMN